MNLEEIDILTKLSQLHNFNEIHEKYFCKKEFQFIREKSCDIDTYKIWYIFQSSDKKSILHLYESLIEINLDYIVQFIRPYNKFINANNVKETIKSYLLDNVVMLSNGLFQAEIKNHVEINYLEVLSNDFLEFEKFIDKYPYWFNLISLFLKDTELFMQEFFSHLIMDWISVTKKFLGEVTTIDNIVLSKGDRHNGRFVIEVKTLKGGFFYKPRRADVDKAFDNWLKVLSSKKGILSMEAPGYICRDNYSWFKKVRYKPIYTLAEKKRYWYYVKISDTFN